MQVIFDHRESTAHNIKTFWFRPERPLRFVAGQFTELYLPHASADERGERRWFTISSSPTEPLLGITTKLSSGQSSTFKQTLLNLDPGTSVHAAEPMGDFVLPKDASTPLVFVAGGMGITPMHSMIKRLHDAGEQRPIQLLYAVTEEDELAFVPLFEAYDCTFTPIVKNPSAGYRGLTGSLDVPRIFELAGQAIANEYSQIYLSGPEPMVENFVKAFAAKGIGQERLVTDYFPGYQQF